MPGKRKEGKKLFGGYLNPAEFNELQDALDVRGFKTRTEFLVWLSSVTDEIPRPKQKKKNED